MHISKVSLTNYRNFSGTKVILHPGVNTVIGENGSGKSNLFRAVRLLLDDTFVTRQHDLQETDFHRGLDDWRGHWIVIRLEFGDVSNDESVQSLLLQHAAEESTGKTKSATYALVFRPKVEVRNKLASLTEGDQQGLAAIRSTITIDDYERTLFGKMSADLADAATYRRIVGDFESVSFPSDGFGNAPSFEGELGTRVQRDVALWREFSLSHIPALRNVVADFNDLRRNPLRALLSAKSDEIPDGDFDSILEKVRDLNNEIEEREDVKEMTRDILETFRDTVGETYSPTSMQIQSELPLEAGSLFKSLKLYVGEHGDSAPRRLHEMSLGGANLIYLTLKLLEFQYRTSGQVIANFLFIEEPEAHIHTHIQKTLFDHVSYQNTQIIYSTHSTHISEVSEIERVNVLARENASWVAMQPAFGLNEQEVHAAQRFLDAVRSNLLFARSVVLVEGDAEELLIPSLVKKVYGVSLDELGVSLVNVRSTGFETLARLFYGSRLRKRCAILTDLDQTFIDTTADSSDDETTVRRKRRMLASAKAGLEREALLDSFQNGSEYVSVAYAPHTFEVDFADEHVANRIVLKSTVDEVYSRKSERESIINQLGQETIAEYGLPALRLAVKAKKGWFALLVGRYLDHADEVGGPVVPEYVLKGIGFAASSLPDETWVRILQHRICAWRRNPNVSLQDVEDAESIVSRIQSEGGTVADALAELSKLDYQDVRILGLSKALDG